MCKKKLTVTNYYFTFTHNLTSFLSFMLVVKNGRIKTGDQTQSVNSR